MTTPDEYELLGTTLARLAETYDGAELSKALDEFGLLDLLVESPQRGVAVLFDAMGNASSSCDALNEVLTSTFSAATGITALHDTLLLPAPGERFAGSVLGDHVTFRALAMGVQRDAGRLIAATEGADGVSWVAIDPATASSRQISGLDAALSVIEFSGDRLPYEVLATGSQATEVWDMVLAAGRRALAYQILGAVNRMVVLATEHAQQRVQFGRPVGSFQAVRHRLADALVAQEGAAAALELSWDADDPILAAMLAKSLAGRAARIAGTHCQQVLAGIGFTAEHPFHRYLNRVMVLDRLIGSSVELPREIGQRLATGGFVPRLVEL
jgi:Acyl-CoA dehydrogenase, C-terminal domain